MQLLGYNVVIEENSYVERQGVIILPHMKYGKNMRGGLVKMVGARVEEVEDLTELGITPQDLINKQVIFPAYAVEEVDEYLEEYCLNTLNMTKPVMIKVGQIVAFDTSEKELT